MMHTRTILASFALLATPTVAAAACTEVSDGSLLFTQVAAAETAGVSLEFFEIQPSPFRVETAVKKLGQETSCGFIKATFDEILSGGTFVHVIGGSTQKIKIEPTERWSYTLQAPGFSDADGVLDRTGAPVDTLVDISK